MPSYIRPHSEESVSLRALMTSALSRLNTTAASRAVSQPRVCESRSDLSCHHREHTSHRTVGYCNFLASTSLLWLCSFLPDQALDHSSCLRPVSPVSIPSVVRAVPAF